MLFSNILYALTKLRFWIVFIGMIAIFHIGLNYFFDYPLEIIGGSAIVAFISIIPPQARRGEYFGSNRLKR